MKENSKCLKFKIPKRINHKKVKSNFTFYFSLLSSKKGITLVEVLVSLTIMMVLLGAILSILNIQRTKSANVSTTAIMQTDAQVALTLFRWDIFMAGYGISHWDDIFIASNSSSGTDSIGMYSMAFGFEASSANWSPVLESSHGDVVKVFRHTDTLSNFKIGDNIVIISQERVLLERDLTISNIEEIDYIAGEDTVPGCKLTLTGSVPVSIGQGTVCIKIDTTSYYDGISYYINSQGQFMRGTEVFLDNVEDIQFSYGIDQNDNGEIDSTEWHNDLSGFSAYDISQHTTMIRATFVVLSDRGLGDYRYITDTLSIEDHTYTLDEIQKKHKRVIVRSITFPRNLRS